MGVIVYSPELKKQNGGGRTQIETGVLAPGRKGGGSRNKNFYEKWGRAVNEDSGEKNVMCEPFNINRRNAT